jgi:creatinine amidohydrolase
MSRQIERLRPHQIEAALSERSLIYLPLGTIEWHCQHLPVGLDGLTAHGLCLRAAEGTGGLVWPVLYYGTGGGHGAFPWTVMMPDRVEIEALLTRTVQRLGQLGVAEVVLFSGHFADEQLQMIDAFAEGWNAQGILPRIKAFAVNRANVPGLPPDHAGLFETTLLDGLTEGLIDLQVLGASPDLADRFDPHSPLWGIVGTDPRLPPPLGKEALVQHIVSKLTTLAEAKETVRLNSRV